MLPIPSNKVYPIFDPSISITKAASHSNLPLPPPILNKVKRNSFLHVNTVDLSESLPFKRKDRRSMTSSTLSLDRPHKFSNILEKSQLIANELRNHLSIGPNNSDVFENSQVSLVLKEDGDRIMIYKTLGEILKRDDNEYFQRIGQLMKDDEEEEIKQNEWCKSPEELYRIESEKFEKIAESQQFIYCEKKNEFELLKIYADPYPFLSIRKKISYFLKLISFLSLIIVQSSFFKIFIFIVVIFNCIMLTIENPTEEPNEFENSMETIFLIIYTLEMALKIIGMGFFYFKHSYLRDFWNILDMLIVITSYMAYLIPKGTSSNFNYSSLRILRVFRPLRTISSIKKLKELLQILFSSIPLLIDILSLLMFFLMVFANIGLHLFYGGLRYRCLNLYTGFIIDENNVCGSKLCDEGNICMKSLNNPTFGITNFDNFLISFVMVFQLVTMQAWSSIMTLVLQAFGMFTVIYFLCLIIIGSFFLLNLTLAVIKAKFTDTQKMKLELGKEIIEKISEISVVDLKWFKRMERLHFKRMKKNREMDVGASDKDRPGDSNSNGITWDDLLQLKEMIKEKKLREEEEKYFNAQRLEIGIDNNSEENKLLYYMNKLERMKRKYLKVFLNAKRDEELNKHKNKGNNKNNVEKVVLKHKKFNLQGIKTIQIKPKANDKLNGEMEEILIDSKNKNINTKKIEFKNEVDFKQLKIKNTKKKMNFKKELLEISPKIKNEFECIKEENENFENEEEDIEHSNEIAENNEKLDSEIEIDSDFNDSFRESELKTRKPETNENETKQTERIFINSNHQINEFKEITSPENPLTNSFQLRNEIKPLRNPNVRHYKMIVDSKKEYVCFSAHDVLEYRAIESVRLKQENLVKSIYEKKYDLYYPIFQQIQDKNILLQIKKNKKNYVHYRELKSQIKLPLLLKTTKKYPENKFFSIPVITRRQFININHVDLKSPDHKKRKKTTILKLDDDLEFSYNCLKNKISEPIINSKMKDLLKEFNNEIEYNEILLTDFDNEKKYSHIWSGQEIAPERIIKGIWSIDRLNKIFDSLTSINRDYIIWLPGIEGYLKVLRKNIEIFLNDKYFKSIIFLSLVVYTLLLTMDGFISEESLEGSFFFFNIFYVSEMILKLLALGNKKYFKENVNKYDFVLAIVNILELFFDSTKSKNILKIFRVFRVARLIRSLNFMNYLLHVIERALEKYLYIAILLLLFMFIYTLLGMQLFGGIFVDEKLKYQYRQNFDSFNNAMIVVFQVLTSTVWQQVLYLGYVAESSSFITFLYLFTWIFIGNYVFLNIFLAIILEEFTQESKEIQEGQKLLLDDIVPKEFLDNNIMNKDQQSSTTNLHSTKKKKGKYFRNVHCSKSFWIFSKKSKFRILTNKISNHVYFETLVIIIIFLNCINMILDTYYPNESYFETKLFDYSFYVFFMIEAIIKIISDGFVWDKGSYLRNSWNILDFLIILYSTIEIILNLMSIAQIKGFKIFRILRPMRLISHNDNLKIVTTALMDSITSIINVFVVILLIWMMFAILGVSLLKDKMGYCSGIDNIYDINYDKCIEMNFVWKNRNTNFDNIGNAMITLFILSSRELWIGTMFYAQDSNYKEFGPSFINNHYIQYYFIGFILIGSYFLLNLLVGVLFFHFNRAQKNEKTKGNLFLTEDQVKWLNIQKMITQAKPDFLSFRKPKNIYLIYLNNLLQNKNFNNLIMLIIILNLFLISLYHESMDDNFKTSLNYIHIFFCFLFFIETFLKIISFGFTAYFYLSWNKFDFCLAILSSIHITLMILSIKFPIYILLNKSVDALFIVVLIRGIKLMKLFKGVLKLIDTLIFSLPSLINVGSLLILIIFIYSILGVILFSNANHHHSITEYYNFENFGFSMLTLFKVLTGDDWFDIMFSLALCDGGKFCGTYVAFAYFISYFLLCSYIVLNLFILIIIQQFEEFYFKENNPIQNFKDNLTSFRKIWSEFSEASLGFNISQKKLIEFYLKLDPPLGFGPKAEKPKVALEIMKMSLAGFLNVILNYYNILRDEDGNIYFNELLYASMKRVFGAEILKNVSKDIKEALENQESAIKLKIEKNTRKLMSSFYSESPSSKLRGKSINKSGSFMMKKQTVNPMITILFVGMTFKCLKKFAERKLKGELLNNDSLPEIDEEEEEEVSIESERENWLFNPNDKDNSDSNSNSNSSSSDSNISQGTNKIQLNLLTPDLPKKNIALNAINKFIDKSKINPDFPAKKNILINFFKK